MREIQASVITDTIERLCIEANQVLPDDIKKSIQACRASEDGEIACGILDNIIENYQIAENEQVPICQDTGMACVFLEIGQDVHIAGGDLTEAVNEGVRRGYTNGYLRKSVVRIRSAEEILETTLRRCFIQKSYQAKTSRSQLAPKASEAKT